MSREHTLPGEEERGSRRPPPDADRLRRLLRFSHIFSAAVQEVLQARYLDEVSADPLTVAQFQLLKLICVNGHHQVGEVAGFLGVSSAAVSKSITKLERHRLVVRVPSPGDRRATLLAASPKGRSLVSEYERLQAQRLEPVLEAFGDEELDHLSRLLERFAVRLYRQERSRERFCLRCGAYCESSCPLRPILRSCPYEKIRSRHRQAPTSEEDFPCKP